MEGSFNYATSWLPSLFTNQTSWLGSQSLCHGTPCHLQIKIPKNGRDFRFLALAAGIPHLLSWSHFVELLSIPEPHVISETDLESLLCDELHIHAF